MSADASGVDGMRLSQSVRNSRVFRYVTVGKVYGNIFVLQAVIDCPAGDVHRGRVAQRCERAFELQFHLASVVDLVARLTERDEIAGAVAAGLAAFDMVDVQDFVFALAVATLALVPVSEQYVFSYVPEAELRSVLVVGPGEAGFPEPLRIELPDLNGN